MIIQYKTIHTEEYLLKTRGIRSQKILKPMKGHGQKKVLENTQKGRQDRPRHRPSSIGIKAFPGAPPSGKEIIHPPILDINELKDDF